MTGTGTGGPIRNLVIVGGGSAGWMTAAALGFMLRDRVSVTLVESDEIGIIGVGEATIPPLREFNGILGIGENEFLAATQGTIKLGIEFVDWAKLGDRYIHPFGDFREPLCGMSFHHFWLRQKLEGGAALDPGSLEDYTIASAAARRGRFAQPGGDRKSVLSTLSYAYHMDASLYASCLRGFAEAHGVKRVEGKITKVEQDPLNGHLTGVVLEDGRRIDGEFFVDCSGFRSLLLGQALGVPYRSWKQWLPCDAAYAVPCASSGPPTPYTRSTAEAGGWRWRIPLQHRIGNGHVFSSAHTDNEVALQRLMEGLDAPPTGEPRLIRFAAGRRERMWDKNCVAIGLSSGFIEPLESTSIHLIQQGIIRLLALFPDQSLNPVEVDKYNRLLIEEYEHIRDFIILHYKATQRDDSDFWNDCRTMEIPDSLAEQLDLWRVRGRVFRPGNSLFTEVSWVAVLLGQNILPEAADPMTGVLDTEANARLLRETRDIIARTADAMPRHEDYIAAHCPASANA